jgi:IclR helix-turn-helix domain
MPKVSNRQVVLKPQDLYVLLALLSRGAGSASYTELAEQTGLAVSAVHGALKRAGSARLAMFEDRRPVVLKPQLWEFLLHGAKYAFAPVWGTLTRGVPTAYGASPLNSVIASSSDPVPVWPYPKGSVRGLSLAPLYPSVPDAALRDGRLYGVLALFDAIRSGQARERNAAQKLLEPLFR